MTILRKVLSDVEAVEVCVAKSIALEAERDRLKAINEELVETLKLGLSLWPGVADGSRPAHPDVRVFVNAARAAIAKARQSWTA